jgi:hypothetical protein
MKNFIKVLRQRVRHPILLILFLFLCFYAAGNATIRNSNCYSSPCSEWLDNSSFHFESSDNLLVAPGMVLLRVLGYPKEEMRAEPPLAFLVPFQSITILSGTDFDNSIARMRTLFVVHTLLKFLHIPLWIMEFWVLEQLWILGRKWSKGLACVLTLVFVLSAWYIFIFSSLGNSYAPDTRDVFFDPDNAGWVAG